MKENAQYQLLEALAIARWQSLINSMRADSSKRHEVIAKILVALLGVVVVGILGLGIATITYASVKRGATGAVSFALWAVFVVWLVVQAGASAAGALSFREIARYPISFRLFCVMQTAYALVEPGTPAAFLMLLVAWIAVLLAKPALAGRTAPMMAGFAFVTLLLTRLVSELLERITSTKKGRRRLLTGMIAFSFLYQFLVFTNNRFKADDAALFRKLGWILSFLPPAIAGHGAQEGSLLMAAFWLAVYAAVLGFPLLWIYVRKYQGELFSDGPAGGGDVNVTPGWQFPLLSNAISAMVEKEFRYTLSQPLGWLNLFYGPLMAALMALGMARSFHLRSDFLFPAVAGWVTLMIGGRAYNSFGFDVTGFHRYLLAPLTMRQVVASKNLLVAFLLAVNFLGAAATLAWIAPFPFSLVPTFIAGILFTSLTSLAAGNFMSVRFPMGVDLETFRAKNASTSGQLSNLVTQMMIIGTLGAVLYWKLPALPVFSILTVGAGALYWTSLDRAAGYAEDHNEEIARSLSV
jgi:hypothetical protein